MAPSATLAGRASRFSMLVAGEGSRDEAKVRFETWEKLETWGTGYGMRVRLVREIRVSRAPFFGVAKTPGAGRHTN